MKIRTKLQPTEEIEVDEHEAKVLEHQGLVWDGTDEELATLHVAAGLPAPKPAQQASAGATASPAGTTQAKGA